MSLVSKISDLCEKSGKTLTSLERECGFGISSIRKWDEHAPTLPKIIKVADALNVTVGEILEENEKPASTLADEFSRSYNLLNAENKKIIDDLVEKLLMSQSCQ